MNVYRIYIFIGWFVFQPFVDDLTKRGRSIWWVYKCMFILFPYFIKKGGEGFWEFMHICFCLCKKEKRIWNLVSLCMFIFLFMCICLFSFMHFIEYLYVYCYAWVKGELLWSLINAYITPWVLSSSKRGRLLAQRPITLVLIMINSCSYCTNDLVIN